MVTLKDDRRDTVVVVVAAAAAVDLFDSRDERSRGCAERPSW